MINSEPRTKQQYVFIINAISKHTVANTINIKNTKFDYDSHFNNYIGAVPLLCFIYLYIFLLLKLSREETERYYQRLMMEHLQLQRSYAQLQGLSGHAQDPQRETLVQKAATDTIIFFSLYFIYDYVILNFCFVKFDLL